VRVILGAEGIQLENVCATPVVICVQRNDDVVVFVDSALALEDTAHDPIGFRIEHDHTEVDGLVIVDHPHFGSLGSRGAVDRPALAKTAYRLGLPPYCFVQNAVYPDRDICPYRVENGSRVACG